MGAKACWRKALEEPSLVGGQQLGTLVDYLYGAGTVALYFLLSPRLPGSLRAKWSYTWQPGLLARPGQIKSHVSYPKRGDRPLG